MFVLVGILLHVTHFLRILFSFNLKFLGKNGGAMASPPRLPLYIDLLNDAILTTFHNYGVTM